MSLKTILNYSPNFSSKKRNLKQIKFIIFHYTGMKSESAAVKKLTKIQSEVSSHYFIKNNGEIISMVPDLYSAWHAGVSFWRGKSSLNKNSIGIEISNPGHAFNYKKFSIEQIKSIIKIGKYLINKYKIKPQNILGHSDIAPFRKKDPGEKFPWKYLAKKKIGIWHSLSKSKLLKNRGLKINKLEKKIYIKNLIKIGYNLGFKNIPKIKENRNLKIISKAFQRRFRQDLINGIIDKECLLISQNLAKKLN
mgnify:CR=1 FL=1